MSAHLHSLAVALFFVGGASALLVALIGPPSGREFGGGEQ